MVSLLQRIIGIVLLTAYAVSGTSVLPAVVSMMATIDEGHQVSVMQSEQGIQITLKHSDASFTPRTEDHETAIARIVVSLCDSAECGDHRHVSVSEISSRSTPVNETLLRLGTNGPHHFETKIADCLPWQGNLSTPVALLLNRDERPLVSEWRQRLLTVQILI